jgi:hypothetical protein
MQVANAKLCITLDTFCPTLSSFCYGGAVSSWVLVCLSVDVPREIKQACTPASTMPVLSWAELQVLWFPV